MSRPVDSRSPDAAITAVLLAERDVQQAIEACRHEAEFLLDAARVKAADIHARADARMTRTHLRCTRAVHKAIDQLVVEQHGILASDSRRVALPDEELDAVAERLAAELTGGARIDREPPK
ncbi:MAG: hypothetical protein WCC36_05695 [Gammaproteobacteria bacterium]